jgi:hypothetical protein
LDRRVAFAESLVRSNYRPVTLMANRSRNEPTATAQSMSRVFGASISLCASCIAASGIGGEVRAR